jgi:Papain family cysteine protease
VLNQGNLGTCVTHGVTEALRYLMNQLNFPDVPLSRLQLYVDARILEGTALTEDTGLEIRDAIKCAAKLGIAHESLWPYDDDTSDTGKFTQMPPANVYADALFNQALLYQGVAVNGPSLRLALASQVPVIFGLMLYDSFQDTPSTGIVRMPNIRRERQIGGHCMICTGYDTRTGLFRVRNSWGWDWGKQGDCFIPEQYITSPKYASDFWVVRMVEGFADSAMADKLKAWLADPQAGVTKMASTTDTPKPEEPVS